MAAHSSDEDLEKKYGGTTVLAIGRILNPITAVQEALATYQLDHLPELPRNVSFRIIWLLQKNRIIPSRTFIVFKQTAPSELKYIPVLVKDHRLAIRHRT